MRGTNGSVLIIARRAGGCLMEPSISLTGGVCSFRLEERMFMLPPPLGSPALHSKTTPQHAHLTERVLLLPRHGGGLP